MTDRLVVAGDDPYEVVVGSGALSQLAALVPAECDASLSFIRRRSRMLSTISRRRCRGRVEVLRIEVPDGEGAKTASVVIAAWDSLGTQGFTRSDLVVAVGGGAVTDVAGFIAATWLRGVRVIQVPTTLLAMVDAAVGGKTGINIAAGKNLGRRIPSARRSRV